MPYIIINNDDNEQMRENMRQQMRGVYRRNVPMRRNATDQYKEGYEEGYRHGWQDAEDESAGMTVTENSRRRNSSGRFM